MHVFKRYVKSFVKYKEATSINTKSLTKHDGFHRVLVSGVNEKKNGSERQYAKHVADVLQNNVAFCEMDDITFRPERKNALSTAASPK